MLLSTPSLASEWGPPRVDCGPAVPHQGSAASAVRWLCLFRVSRGSDHPPGPKPELPVFASGVSRLPGSVPPAARRDHSRGVNRFFKVWWFAV